MTNLSRLKVSLTKHGIHKLAKLIQFHNRTDILRNVWGKHAGININEAQVSSVLSIDKKGNVPQLWDEIKILGEEDIQDIVFISIIFSHFKLIKTFQKATQNNCIVKRGDVIDGKAFTNLAHTIDQFKYSVTHTIDQVSFDISRIFHKPYLNQFIIEIFDLKLKDAGWGGGDIISEALDNDFHRVFNLSDTEFKSWLVNIAPPKLESIQKLKAKRNFKEGINFKSGHSPKFTGTSFSSTRTGTLVTYIHNSMQNVLFEILNDIYPHAVGTEVMANSGSIDLVVRYSNIYDLYEIKTSNSSRTNIRQGLSQILEYAFWGSGTNIKVNELIIIGKPKPNKDSIAYLQLLRSKFNIPVYYQSLDITKRTLSQKY